MTAKAVPADAVSVLASKHVGWYFHLKEVAIGFPPGSKRRAWRVDPGPDHRQQGTGVPSGSTIMNKP